MMYLFVGFYLAISIGGQIISAAISSPDYFKIDDMMFRRDPKRAGPLDTALRWPKGRIPYVISRKFSASEANEIQGSMDYIQSLTCIKFTRRRKSDKNYLHIIREKGTCQSYLGDTQAGAQKLQLDPDSATCANPTLAGHVLHELVHAIGFFHEHTRDDRNSYIEILFDRLPTDKQTEKLFNRNIDNGIHTGYFGVPYNYGSIMHYPAKAGPGNQITIRKKKIVNRPRPLPGKLGQREKLSYGDIKMIQTMYSSVCPDGVNIQNLPETQNIPSVADFIKGRQHP